MLTAILIFALIPIGLLCYLFGHSNGYKAGDRFPTQDDMDSPIYNQMALEYPETFLFMKSKESWKHDFKL